MSTSSTTSSGSGMSWIVWILVILGGLFAFGMVSFFVVMIFGPVTGQEFSPDTFARRDYVYLQVPLVGWQLTPIGYLPGDIGAEADVTGAGLIPAGTNPPRWHYIGTLLEPRQTWRYPAAILLHYLDAGPQGSHTWGTWTKEHPDRAKVFWPIVADLARHEQYALLPDLFELAEAAKDATELKHDLEAKTAELLREDAQRRQANGQSAEAVEICTRSLALVPKAPLTLLVRAEAYTSLGDTAKAAADQAKAAELKQQALRPGSVGGALDIETPRDE